MRMACCQSDPSHLTLRQSVQESLTMLLFDLLIVSSVRQFRSDLLFFYFGCVLLLVAVLQNMCSVRIDTLGQMTTFPRFFHIRMLGLLAFIQSFLAVLIPIAILLMPQDAGPIGIVSQYFISLMVMQVNLFAQIALYYCEYVALTSEGPWDEKSRYVFFIGYVRDIVMLLVYPFSIVLSFLFVNMHVVFLPFGTFRQFILLAYSVYKKTLQLLRFRAATRDMDRKYPPLSQSDVVQMHDKTCIICREDFDVDSRSLADTPRKLPCSHVFHFRCLHSWLERQQNCPTCRRDVLAPTPAAQNTSDPNTVPTQTPEPSPLSDAQTPDHLGASSGLFREQVSQQQVGHDAAQQTMPAGSIESASLQSLISRLSPQAEATSSRDTLPSMSALLSPEASSSRSRPEYHLPVKDDSTAAGLDPREAVRQAALKRFGTREHTLTATNHKDTATPGLIPLFDPASIHDFSSRVESKLPHPLVSWAASRSSLAPDLSLSTEQLAQITDEHLRRRLCVLQDTNATLERTIAQIQEVLRPSATAPYDTVDGNDVDHHNSSLHKGKSRDLA